jgi:nicotinamidase/pyrazinamidase
MPDATPDPPATVPGPADALLVVDLQNDFLPGGALAVPSGDAVVPVVNAWAAAFAAAGRPVIATRDWHPPGHVSFTGAGGPWPAHCVAGTRGAEFASGLVLPPGHVVLSKATTAERDAYSGFDGTGLADRLRAAGVRRVVLAGLATDYCVRATGADALAAGFEVVVLTDAVRGVELAPGDSQRALDALALGGARFLAGAPGAAT